MKKQPRGAYSVGSMLNHYGVFELCLPKGTTQPCFAVKTKGKPTEYLTEVKDTHFVYKPYEKVPWQLPNEPLQYESEETLWKEVKECIKDHLDFPDTQAYNVLTAWTFSTWQLEKWQAVPYLFFFGAFATGKTRALELLSHLSHRGWLGLYVSPANLYRPLEAWKPTLFLDEAEVYGDMKHILALLNGSYRKGQLVPRQVETAEGFKTEFFDNFGFKAMAGTRNLAQTLRSRCITFRMSQATRKIRLFIDEDRCTELRSKLLMYRFNHLIKGEDVTHGEDTRGEKDIEEFAENVGSARLAELFYPLYTVAPNRQVKNEILMYAIELKKERLEELKLSPEVTVLTAILEAKRSGLMQHGRIQIRDVADVINSNLPLNEAWTNRFVGAICSRLGFTKTRLHGGATAIIINPKILERLKKDARYASCFEPPSPPTPSPSSPPSPSVLNTCL